jgi:REP element-mobilizing transposase RayT
MGLRFAQKQHDRCFFVTTTFRDWRNLGKIQGFYERLADSLSFCSSKYDASLFAYVFMPTHIHLLLAVAGDRLSDFMRDFKKYISQKVACDLDLGTGGVWMPRYDRVVILTEEVFRIKLEYIHYNPVKDGLVVRPADWKWSSAADYVDGVNGAIPICNDWI